jgi:tetratricopeptide (TPR) repeat protein
MGRRRKERATRKTARHSDATLKVTGAKPAAQSLPLWKKVLYALVVNFAFFLALESFLFAADVTPILRGQDPYVGFSGYIQLYVKERTKGEPAMRITAPNKAHIFNPQRFTEQKTAGTYRIFCLGGSTTYGRPYDDTTSFCGWMRAFLPVADPSRAWEVINAGGISYASYRVALLMEELVRYEPDLFIIYTGHNEFLERRTYGEILEMPALLRELDAILAHTRIYAVLHRFLRDSSESSPDKRPELPAEVHAVLDASVGPDDYTRDDEGQLKVLEHYRFNLGRMVESATASGADAIFVAPASNLASCAPFKSEHRSGLKPDQLERWRERMVEAEIAYSDGRSGDALSLVDEALAIDDRYAESHYFRGRALASLLRNEAAKTAFARARDEDVCPLRALSPMDAIVTEVTREKDVPLVDFRAVVERLSPGGVPGDEMFLDHVHPTVEGNRLLALALLDNMAERGIVDLSPAWDDAAIREVAETVESQLDPATRASALRNLAKVLSWAGKFEEAAELAQRALEVSPDDAEAHYVLGVSLDEEGRHEEAFSQYELATRMNPDHASAHLNLGLAFWERRGDMERARFHLERAVRIQPGDSRGQKALGIVLSQLGRLAEARDHLERSIRSDPSDPQAHYDLGTVVGKLGDGEKAATHYRAAIALEPDYAEAHNNLGIVLVGQGDLMRAQSHFEEAIRIAPGFTAPRQNLEYVRTISTR